MRVLLAITIIALAAVLVVQHLCKQGQDVHGDMGATVDDILSDNKDADIFKYHNLIYMNVESSPHINVKDFQRGESIGKIMYQSNDVNNFTNGTATKLPQGTKIYQTVGKGLSILTIEINDKNVIYMALLDDVFLQE